MVTQTAFVFLKWLQNPKESNECHTMGGDAEPCPPRLASWFSNASNLLPPLILVAGGLQADGRVALSGAAFVFLKWLQNLKESNGLRTMSGDAQPCR